MKIQKNPSILAILMIFLGLMLCACTSQTPESGIIQNRRGTGIKDTEQSETAAEKNLGEEDAEDSIVGELFIIIKVDTEKKKVSLEKVSSGRQMKLSYDTGTMFLDKYGNTKAMTAFLPGDAVTIDVAGDTQKLKKIQLSKEVWVQEDIKNYSIDETIGGITIGQTRYSYDKDMEVFSGDTKISFSGISKSDILRAVGMDQKIISLSVTKGHGYLKLANTEIFEGSFICVGDKIFQKVTKNMQLEIPEGKYLVTVANNGYGGSREVSITRDQTTSLNLDELKGEGPKICKITFHVGVNGAVLRLDGKETDYSKPIEVKYGIHSISVEAEGYDTLTEKLVVNSPKAEIEIALTSSLADTSEETAENEENTAQNHTQNTNTDARENTNTNTDTNTNTNTNTDTNTNGTATEDSSTDYLTTLYNLLNSINDASGTNSDASSTLSLLDSYNNLVDE